VLVDVGLAIGIAALVLLIAPGLAVVAIVALLVLAACGVSLAVEARKRRVQRRR
jgi:hypothetical protein